MENSQTPPPEPAHLLDDIEYTYQQASGGTRFSNLLIDRLLLYGLWRLLLYFFAYPIGWVIYTIGGDNQWLRLTASYVLVAAMYLIYYTAFESLTGGKTIGKYITRTRAVNAGGSRMPPRTALLRSLCRFIPFDAFSALGKPSFPWHDRLSKTLVVDERLTQLPPWE